MAETPTTVPLPTTTTTTKNIKAIPAKPPPVSSSDAMVIDGSNEDLVFSQSEVLTREEVLRRRTRRLKQLASVYKDHYWSLMEELKIKYREYYWEYGKSPFQEDEIKSGNNDDNSGPGFSRCGVHGCKSKAMALTKFCHTHILSDAKQKLYMGCNYVIKSSQAGPILCGKPILKSTVPSLCPLHLQKAEKHLARALKKAGLNVTSTSKLAPKFHVIVREYVHQIQNKRRIAQRAITDNSEIKEEDNSL